MIDPRVQELINDVIDANQPSNRPKYSIAQRVAIGRNADRLAAELTANLVPEGYVSVKRETAELALSEFRIVINRESSADPTWNWNEPYGNAYDELRAALTAPAGEGDSGERS